MATRDPQSPARNTLATGIAVGGGGAGYLLALALGATQELSMLLGGLWTAMASVVGPWSRDRAHKDGSNLLYRFLSLLGCAVLMVGLSGCSLKAGVAIGPERYRIIEVLYEGEGMGTFCWLGAGWQDIGIREVGWGPDECRYLPNLD